MKNTNMNRRTFLKVTTIAGAGMLVGCSYQSNPNLSTPNGQNGEFRIVHPSIQGQQHHHYQPNFRDGARYSYGPCDDHCRGTEC